jgi:hypothetical protein
MSMANYFVKMTLHAVTLGVIHISNARESSNTTNACPLRSTKFDRVFGHVQPIPNLG